MFCVKGFADGTSAEQFSGFAAIAIRAIDTVAIDAAKKPAGNSGAPPTFGTEKLQKADLTK
jgi:hypothetical protein